jgi:hypothetical protein
MKVDRWAADSLAAMSRSAELIDIASVFRQPDAFDQQTRLTENLLAMSQSLRSLSAKTRENARQIRAYGQRLRAAKMATVPYFGDEDFSS